MRCIVFFILVVFTGVFSSAQNFPDPLTYYKYFNTAHANISNKNMVYIQTAVHSDDFMAIEKKRIELIQQIEHSLEKIKKTPPYEEDQEMKKESMAVLELYLQSFEIEFNQVNLLKKDSRESYEAMEKYFQAVEQAEQKIEEASDRFTEAQRGFAKRHDIILVKAPENTQITDLNSLNAYHRRIFLHDFKISKINANFMDAVDKRDAETMEKYRIELIEESKNTLKILKLMPPFKEDTQYRDAAVTLVEFYQTLAKDSYVNMVKVVGKEDLTNEDVGIFNKAIEAYNTKIPELSGQFHQAGESLMRKYVPKPIETKRI